MLIDGLEKGLAWDFESGKGDLKETRNMKNQEIKYSAEKQL